MLSNFWNMQKLLQPPEVILAGKRKTWLSRQSTFKIYFLVKWQWKDKGVNLCSVFPEEYPKAVYWCQGHAVGRKKNLAPSDFLIFFLSLMLLPQGAPAARCYCLLLGGNSVSSDSQTNHLLASTLLPYFNWVFTVFYNRSYFFIL